MALIDSNNFITHLVWSGVVDKATCGELKEAIELCTVKDIYTKADMAAMLTELDNKIMEEYIEHMEVDWHNIIQQKINALKEDKDV